MPAPVYSTRFIITTAGDVFFPYLVPAGRRAVVTFVSAKQESDQVGLVKLAIGSTVAWLAPLPGVNTGVSASMRLVVYAGETLYLFCTGNVRGIACGYLFDDTLRGALVHQAADPVDEPLDTELGDRLELLGP